MPQQILNNGQLASLFRAALNSNFTELYTASVATDTIFNAAGDLIVGTADNTAARLAMGANGTSLTVVSGAVVWAVPAGGGDVTLAGVQTLSNKTLAGYVLSGAEVVTATAIPALVINVALPLNTKSISAPATFTFSNSTPTANTRTELKVTVDATERVITIPSTWSYARNALITTITIPASTTLWLLFEYTGARWEVTGDPVETTGTGAYVRQTVTDALDLKTNIGVPQSLRNMTRTNITPATEPIAFAYFDNFTWGSNTNGDVYKSTDVGLTWTLVQSALLGIIAAIKSADGEVVATNGASVYKSTGWATNPATATFAIKYTAAAPAYILAHQFDGDGTKFIVSEYAALGVDPSRYVTISLDMGETWTRKYDSPQPIGSHLHASCYDPWEDRFWFVNGHNPIANFAGLHFSDDNGDSWTRCTSTKIHQTASYIPIKATEFGLICATDSSINGIWIMPRCDDPTNADPYLAWEWEPLAAYDGNIGFGIWMYRDTDTGIVYISLGSIVVGVGSVVIAASDGRTAGAAHVFTAATTVGDAVHRFVAKGGLISGSLLEGGVQKKFRAQTNAYLHSAIDPRGILETLNVVSSSLAVGGDSNNLNSAIQSTVVGKRNSTASTAQLSVIVGQANTLTGLGETVIIGNNVTSGARYATLIGSVLTASGNFQTAIGRDCNVGSAGVTAVGSGVAASGSNSVGVGFGITATAASAVGVGYSITVLGASTGVGTNLVGSGVQSVMIGTDITCGGLSVAIGHTVTAGDNSVGIGRGVTAINFGIAIGYGALANGLYQSIAIGYEAICTHDKSVALGVSATTTATSQIQIGARHIELIEVTEPAAPSANGLRIYPVDDAGVTKLRWRTSVGIYEVAALATSVSFIDVTATGNLICSVVGKGLQLKPGSNTRCGEATLVVGTITVSNTTVTANTQILLTRKTSNGTTGTLNYTLSAGASFTINSNNVLDTSVITYLLIEVN